MKIHIYFPNIRFFFQRFSGQLLLFCKELKVQPSQKKNCYKVFGKSSLARDFSVLQILICQAATNVECLYMGCYGRVF